MKTSDNLPAISAQEILQALNQSAIISVADLNGRIIHANELFCSISGYQQAELLGNSHRILSSGKHDKSFWANMWQTISRGQTWKGDVCNKSKSGELYWVETFISPIKDTEGNICQYLSIRYPINDRKEKEHTIQKQNEELRVLAEELTQNIEELRAAQEQLQILSEVAREVYNGVVITDSEGKIEWVNNGFERITGYTFDEVKGRKPGFVQGPATSPADVQKIREGLASRKPFTQEILNYHKNGQPYRIELYITPVTDEHGQVLRFIGIQNDVTERILMAERLEKNRYALEQTNQVAKIGYWESDLETGELYWSDITCQILGVVPGFIPDPKTGLSFISDNYRKQVEETLFRCQVDGKGYDMRIPIQTFAGEHKWTRAIGHGEMKNGKCVRLFGTFQDITEQVMQEQAIVEARQRLQQFFNLTDDFIAISDGKRGYFELINHAFVRKTGYTEAELMTQPFISFLHPDDLPAALQVIKEAQNGRQIVHFESRFRKKNGTYIWLNWSIAIPDLSSGKGFATARDVTIQRKNRNLSKLTALLSEGYLTDETQHAYLENVLSALLEATESSFGFLAEVLYDEHGTPYIKSRALTDASWDQNSKQLYEKHAIRGIEFRNLNTLFGHVIRNGGDLVISNDPATDERSGGVPPGHFRMENFMGIPVFTSDTKLVGMIGLANRPGGYTLSDTEDLRSFVAILSIVFQNYKNEKARQDAEKALLASRNQYQALVENMEGITVRCLNDEHFTPIYVSEQIEQLTGYSAQAFISGEVTQITHPADRQRGIRCIREAIRQNKPWEIEYRVAHKDGSVRVAFERGKAIRDENGYIRYLDSFILDLTERKQMELTIRTQNKELQDGLESFLLMGQQVVVERQKTEKLLQTLRESINYASRIQKAILPEQEELRVHFEHFVFFRPKDVVSGDFFWFADKGKVKIIAVVDCTGHGVAGGFMTIIANNLLNKIVHDLEILHPNLIADHMHRLLSETLLSAGSNIKDGMDLAIVAIRQEDAGRTLSYAGVGIPMYYVPEDGPMLEIKADKVPISGRTPSQQSYRYQLHEISVRQPITLYLSSDGYADQFGGAHNSKINRKNFRNLLHQVSGQKIEVQKNILSDYFDSWKGKEGRQTDDVLIVGLKI